MNQQKNVPVVQVFCFSQIYLLSDNPILIAFCLHQNQKIPLHKASRNFPPIQIPRRETYYPCESLISRTINGDYFTFYHNYFMLSKT